MNDQQRDELRALQDHVIELAEELGYDLNLQCSTEYPGCPTIRRLRYILYPQWIAAIESAKSYLQSELEAHA